MYSFLVIKGYAYSKSLWEETIQTGTFIFRFMEVEPCGKNALPVLREWKKP